MTQSALFGKGTHPRTATLCGATEIVAIEECDGFSIFVDYLKDLHVGMVGRNIFALLESQSIGTMGCIENAIDLYAVDIKIRLDLIIGNVELFFFHFR